MKKLLLFLFIYVGIQQADATNKNLIDFNSTSLVFSGETNLDYQRQVSDWLTIGPKLIASSGELSHGGSPLLVENYIGLGISTFFYLKNWYLNLNTFWANVEVSSGIDDKSDSGIFWGVGIGHHWRWSTFSLKIGLDARFSPLNDNDFTVQTGSNSSSSSSLLIGDDSNIILTPEVRLGWLF